MDDDLRRLERAYRASGLRFEPDIMYRRWVDTRTNRSYDNREGFLAGWHARSVPQEWMEVGAAALPKPDPDAERKSFVGRCRTCRRYTTLTGVLQECQDCRASYSPCRLCGEYSPLVMGVCRDSLECSGQRPNLYAPGGAATQPGHCPICGTFPACEQDCR